MAQNGVEVLAIFFDGVFGKIFGSDTMKEFCVGLRVQTVEGRVADVFEIFVDGSDMFSNGSDGFLSVEEGRRIAKAHEAGERNHWKEIG